MSYDGFRQQWCAGGHQHHTQHDMPSLEKCPQCDAPIVFTHAVDQTGGYMDDEIETEWTGGAGIDTRFRIPTEADVAAAKERRKLAEARAALERQENA